MRIMFILFIQLFLVEQSCISQQKLCERNLKNAVLKGWSYDSKQKVYLGSAEKPSRLYQLRGIEYFSEIKCKEIWPEPQKSVHPNNGI